MDYGTQDVECPFFRYMGSKGRSSIICEGAICGTTSHQFKGLAQRDVHFRRYCCANYEDCLHFLSVIKKYCESGEE